MIYRYFKYPLAFSILGLILAFFSAYKMQGDWRYAGIALFQCLILALLEISLSFDNAIVNASIVKNMDSRWQKIFLYFGIFIAVFGMRILLPLFIVMIVLKQNLFFVLHLAFYEPQEYMHSLAKAQMNLNIFGASFLSLVGLSFFLDEQKTTHWLQYPERLASYLGRFNYMPFFINLSLAAVCFYFYAKTPEANLTAFIISFLLGNVCFYLLKILGAKLEDNELPASGWRSFLYLEILDSTFSFDGVLGAFALSNNFIIIIIGLAIGAFYVRSMTLMLVHENSLARFIYIEHGAFYAILCLALTMYAKVNIEIGEYLPGILSVSFILGSLLHSKLAAKQ